MGGGGGGAKSNDGENARSSINHPILSGSNSAVAGMRRGRDTNTIMRTDYEKLLLKETALEAQSSDLAPPPLTWLASIGIPSACHTEGRV